MVAMGPMTWWCDAVAVTAACGIVDGPTALAARVVVVQNGSGWTDVPAWSAPDSAGRVELQPELQPGLSHTYDVSFTVTDATTTPFRVPVSRNDGCGPLGSSTTAAISPSLA